jgi:uncharacterized membrane protein SirB2
MDPSAYLLVKSLHVTLAVLSITGFAARGVLMLCDSPLLGARAVRIAPHIVDTLLLASAITLAWMLKQYPFVHGWITAKVLALFAYIALGSLALRPGRPKAVRAAALVAALAAVGYIVSVALTRDPRGALVWIT